MKVFIAAAALLLTAISTPGFTADYKATECVSGRFREPLCHPDRWHRSGTVVIEEREPDVIMLPHAPYVIVNWPRRMRNADFATGD